LDERALMLRYAYIACHVHSVYWISCCPHADQILSKLPAPDKRSNSTGVDIYRPSYLAVYS
jgi:hypothetical protein